MFSWVRRLFQKTIATGISSPFNRDLKSLLITIASAEPMVVKDTALENTPGSTCYPLLPLHCPSSPGPLPML